MHGSWIVDTDPGLGLPWVDVDDALAIAHLWAHLRTHGGHLAALTTIYGNTDIDRTTAVARMLGERLGIAVYRGASRPGDTQTDAVTALVGHKGSVLGLGPLTNIAAALRSGAQWERLVLLGGTSRRMPNLRPLHTTELNLALDEPSAAVALERCTDLVPMEPCRRVWFTQESLCNAPAWLSQGCRHWLRTSPLRTGRCAFHPWDLLAAVWITHPQLFRADMHTARLASRPLWRGSIRYENGSTNVTRDVDATELLHTFAETIVCLPA